MVPAFERERVKHYIKNCLKCIEFSPKNGKIEGCLHSIPKGKVPFFTIHIDHFGPLQKTINNNKHVLSVADVFTKFIRLYTCKTTKTEETVKHLEEYFRAYSVPKRVITDRGTTFTSKEFSDFVNNHSCDHILSAVSTPRANGQVERFNRDIKPMLSKLSENTDKCDRELQRVEFTINNTLCRSTGETPSMLLFGVSQVGEMKDNVRRSLESYVEKERNLEKARQSASENIVKSQCVNERYYNESHKAATTYKVGDYIMIRNVETTANVNKKLIPKFKGPYVVKEVLDNDRYVIGDIDGFQLTQRPYNGILGPDQMKHWVRI